MITTARGRAASRSRLGRRSSWSAGDVRALCGGAVAVGDVAALVGDSGYGFDAEVLVEGGHVSGDRRRSAVHVDAVVAVSGREVAGDGVGLLAGVDQDPVSVVGGGDVAGELVAVRGSLRDLEQVDPAFGRLMVAGDLVADQPVVGAAEQHDPGVGVVVEVVV